MMNKCISSFYLCFKIGFTVTTLFTVFGKSSCQYWQGCTPILLTTVAMVDVRVCLCLC